MDPATAAFSSVAQVATEKPRRYLGQLCKHFEHKIPATYDAEYRTGKIEFGAGVCVLEADDGQGLLIMRVEAANEADLARLEDVVARHLVRFAFREPPTITWSKSA